MKYCFGDIVVVENNLIGVVVKSWLTERDSNIDVSHDVYVRLYNSIKRYPESQIQRYMVRHKYLDASEIIWQDNAVNNRLNSVNKQNVKKIELLNVDIYELFFDGNYDEDLSTIIVDTINNQMGIFTIAELLDKSPIDIFNVLGKDVKYYQYLILNICSYCDKYNIKSKYSKLEYDAVI